MQHICLFDTLFLCTFIPKSEPLFLFSTGHWDFIGGEWKKNGSGWSQKKSEKTWQAGRWRQMQDAKQIGREDLRWKQTLTFNALYSSKCMQEAGKEEEPADSGWDSEGGREGRVMKEGSVERRREGRGARIGEEGRQKGRRES